MPKAVSGSQQRTYRSTLRRQQAMATRTAVLRAARSLFVERGYAATTIADIASEAGVAVDTVYNSVGRKPTLMRELIEASISGTDSAVPAADRAYVHQLTSAPDARTKLQIYATAVVAIQERLAPVFMALRDAALTDPACRDLWAQIAQRRARNMLELAADLRATGELRADLSDQEVADIIWSTNAAEFWALLVRERGWPPERCGTWLADAWIRLLLAER